MPFLPAVATATGPMRLRAQQVALEQQTGLEHQAAPGNRSSGARGLGQLGLTTHSSQAHAHRQQPARLRFMWLCLKDCRLKVLRMMQLDRSATSVVAKQLLIRAVAAHVRGGQRCDEALWPTFAPRGSETWTTLAGVAARLALTRDLSADEAPAVFLAASAELVSLASAAAAALRLRQ